MTFGNRDNERFWIALIVRFAFGMMFLIASLNIFTYFDKTDPPDNPDRTAMEYVRGSLDNFVKDLKAPYEATWMNFKWSTYPVEADTKLGATVGVPIGIHFIEWFLYAMPFVFLLLSICLLTGLAYRFALRASAFYLVMLGLGKYVVGDSATTAQDFIFAAFICVALFLSAREDHEPVPVDETAAF